MSRLVYPDQVRMWSRLLRSVSDEQGANAAVAMLLKIRDEDLNVLLVKRVENCADPWSGQMAFPGGKRDRKDQSLMQTIIRETFEETSVNLQTHSCFLGTLKATHSKPKPDLKILPFVILVEHEQAVRLSEKELAGYFWIPLQDIIQGEGKTQLCIGRVPAYIIGPLVIWGLTYRIIKDFVKTVALD